jgi:hypothetical protein
MHIQSSVICKKESFSLLADLEALLKKDVRVNEDF